MALGDNLGVSEVTMVGKLTDDQIALTDNDLTIELLAIYNAKLSSHTLQVKSGESATVLFNRTLRKYKISALTEDVV